MLIACLFYSHAAFADDDGPDTLELVGDGLPVFPGTQMNQVSSPITATFMNTGESVNTILSVGLVTGTQFSIVPAPYGTTCVSSLQLAPGGSCRVVIVFNPTYNLSLAGWQSDTIKIAYTDATYPDTETVEQDVAGTSLILLPTVRLDQGSCTDILGNSKLGHTVASHGCAVSSLADALNYASLNRVLTPCSLNSYALSLNKNDSSGNPTFIGFNKTADIFWTNVTNIYTGGKNKFISAPVRSDLNPTAFTNLIDTQLAAGIPVIVGVKIYADKPNSKPYAHHHVLVNGQAVDSMGNNTYSIDDSAELLSDRSKPRSLLLNGSNYGNYPFQIDGYIQNMPLLPQNRYSSMSDSDLSETDISVDANADIMVTDSSGNQTGFDPVSNQILSNIPGAVYSTIGLEDATTEVSADEPMNSVYIYGSGAQNYTITVNGINTGPSNLFVFQYDSSGTLQAPISITGNAIVGSIDQFTIMSGQVIPVVTPTPIPTATPSPSPSPTPQANGIVSLASDKQNYAVGDLAVITATVSASYVLQPNASLIIEGSLNGGAPIMMTGTGVGPFIYKTPALGESESFVATIELIQEPSAMASLDSSILKFQVEIQSSSGINRFWAQVELVFFEIAKAVLGLFQHSKTQVLETDTLNLMVNSNPSLRR